MPSLSPDPGLEYYYKACRKGDREEKAVAVSYSPMAVLADASYLEYDVEMFTGVLATPATPDAKPGLPRLILSSRLGHRRDSCDLEGKLKGWIANALSIRA